MNRQLQSLAEKLAPIILPILLKLFTATGTYTPTYLGNSTAGTTTYTTQAGFYTRFGRVVFFNGRVVWTAATGTGTAIISLPFTPGNVADQRFSPSVFTTNVTFANSGTQGSIAPAQQFFAINSPATNAAGALVAVETAGDIVFSGFFYV